MPCVPSDRSISILGVKGFVGNDAERFLFDRPVLLE